MYTLNYTQKLPISLETSWKFFSSAENLKLITPEYMGFEILTKNNPNEIYAGQIIAYNIRPVWNIKIEWVTEIAHVQKPLYFIDEQRFGPYSFWHHEHWFNSIPNGVEISDLIYYKMPFGYLGKALNAFKVKNDLEAIFAYRKTKLEKLFGVYKEAETV